ncbi:MAG: GDSL-type esterase/lipase family protein [Lachnospiraceae bacterium]
MQNSMRAGAFAVCGACAACLAGLAAAGRYVGWGPFGFLEFDKEERAIRKRYDADTRKGEIVFYGASNFRLWTRMDEDLAPYPVQNHGFGGCTDKDLMERADTLLYPYAPRLVFLQTGSNDYARLAGTDEEKVAACMATKREMFDAFHEALPDARFVVMSGLLLPGRRAYTAITRKVNRELEVLCGARDDMTFVDASAMTFDGTNYNTELFRRDGIHLNHEGELAWRDGYILPVLEKLWVVRT